MPFRPKFYLNGGGLFTVQGRWWDNQVESLFGRLGASVYNPWRESNEGKLRNQIPAEQLRNRIFKSDRNGVDVSQGVIMLAEGSAGEVSSGTAWEVGYAYARKKLILCIRTDFRGQLNPLLKGCLFDGIVTRELKELRIQARRAVDRIRESRARETIYEPPPRKSRIRKVFLSSPYFSEVEESYAGNLLRGLSKLGYEVLFPPGELDARRRALSDGDRIWSRIFERKVRALEECDAVVALLEGPDCGTETGWDCGYGYSKYKPVFGMRTDFRSLGDLAGPINLMIEQSLVKSRLCGSLAELGRLIMNTSG